VNPWLLIIPLAYFWGKRVGRYHAEREAMRRRLRVIQGGKSL
jgi:hypothetical protein